ncbi:unnamed protein product [Scytosiphon promiscuus]
MDQAQRVNPGQRLAWAVERSFLRGVELALNDGADVNGSGTDLPRPIVVAAYQGHLGVLKLLIDQGADLEATVSGADRGSSVCIQQPRAVHAAVEGGQTDALRVLLQAGADPNCLTSEGHTPLMLVSVKGLTSATRLEMADVLLIAGADPLLGRGTQLSAMAIHYAAQGGETLLVSKLLSSAPTTLNAVSRVGGSPLTLACYHGHAETVSFLLSVGASDAEHAEANGSCALFAAVVQGQEEVARILLDEGFEAVGGLFVIRGSMACSVEKDNVCILQMLLNVQGGDMQEALAGIFVPLDLFREAIPAEPILHIAARFCAYRAAHVLLSAGADELAVDSHGKQASEFVGSSVETSADSSWQVAKEDAFRRMLKCGPALRARSWVWPTPRQTVVGIAAERTRPVSSSVRAPALGARVLWQKYHRFFPRALARYVVAGDPPVVGHPSDVTLRVESEEGTEP